MKKTVLLILTAALIMSLLCGCGSSEETEPQSGDENGATETTRSPFEPGNTYIFGKYEQDNDLQNGKEKIEWIILAHEDSKVLLISRYALDCMQYNDRDESVMWETSPLRRWLNETFIDKAFDSSERSRILSVNAAAGKNPQYDTNPGNDTTDRVFLLSIDEANEYFASNEDRKCAPTKYAIAEGAYSTDKYKKDNKDTCVWWLRSPGAYSYYAATVYHDGSVQNVGSNAHNIDCAVRPAIWIDLLH